VYNYLEILKKSHILVISEKVFPEEGTELATYLILQLLSSKGFCITVLTEQKRPMLVKDINYIYSPYLKSIIRLIFGKIQL
jgi:hypothetical protein